MKAIDKFGRPIYGRTWERIVDLGNRLLRAGYVERVSKPNLFVRIAETDTVEGRFYADFRGTEVVPIWEDSDPLFYAFFRPEPPAWKQRRLQLREVGRLMSGFGVPVRFSFYATSEPGGLFFGDYKDDGGFVDAGDGYCFRCGSDFRDEGPYCPACRLVIEQEAKEARMIECAACQGSIDPWAETYIRHHVTYFPESVATVHDRCHADIHLNGKYPGLAPPAGDAAKFYRDDV